MSQTTSPKKPKTPPSSPHLLPRSVQGRRAPSIPALPANPDFLPKVINDAKIVLMTILENKSDWQVSKHQVWKESHLSKTRVTKALNYLRFERFVADVVVRKSGRLHGWCFRVDLNGNVEQGGWVIHYSQDKDEFYDYGARRKEMKREKAGLSTPKRSKKRKAQSHSVSGGSERAPLHPHIEEPVCDEKKEPLTPAEQGDVSSFEESQTTGLPAELLSQVDEIMAETQDLITTPEARQGIHLSPTQEETLLTRHRGFLLAEAREEGEAYPCVTNTDDARLLREAYRKYGLSSFPGQAQLALDSDANRVTRPVHFLMTSLRLRAYPDFNPAFAELGLWQEPSGLSDAWLLGKVAIEKLKALRKSTGKHLHGADAHNWLQHSLPGRLILATLAPDQELSDKVAHDLCRQFARERESLTLEKAARFWMLRLGMRRPILVDRLCDFIHAALKEDDVYDPLLGITEERMRAYCGVELMPPSGRPDWRAALTFDNYGSGFQDGWDMADLMHGLTRVSKRAVVWREDVHDGDRAVLLQVLVLRQQMPDGSLTAQRIDELLVQIGHSQNRYQRWLVETPRGRNTFVSAVKSGLVPAEMLQAAVGMDGIEHTDRVRLLAAMCEASISALRGSKL
jgi:hypothetical protein